jgi:hypothetical protein
MGAILFHDQKSGLPLSPPEATTSAASAKHLTQFSGQDRVAAAFHDEQQH